MVPKWTSKYIAHRDDIGSLRSDQQGDRTLFRHTSSRESVEGE
jgi:hypothetical protein